MGKYSSDEAVDAAVQAAEDDYAAALESYREGGMTTDQYKEARDHYFAARQIARAGRGMAINTD